MATSHHQTAWALCLCLLIASTATCKRAGDGEERLGGTPATAPTEQLPGLVVGQVVTRTGDVAAQRPIEGISDIDMGRQFRRAVRNLPMFEDEGGPGPTINFDLTFAIGLGSAEPPPEGRRDELPPVEGSGAPAATGPAQPGSDDDAEYAILLLEVRGEADSDLVRVEFDLRGLYRERVAPGETPTEAGRRLVDEGIADIVEGIRIEAAPRCASDQELIDMLDDDDPDQLLAVIREVHRRRLVAAASALREHLRPDPAEVTLAAASALGQIRDPEAVGQLIDLISRERREMTPFVLPILGEIDTPEARAYLATVADAHASAEIRLQARQILDEMLQRP